MKTMRIVRNVRVLDAAFTAFELGLRTGLPRTECDFDSYTDGTA